VLWGDRTLGLAGGGEKVWGYGKRRWSKIWRQGDKKMVLGERRRRTSYNRNLHDEPRTGGELQGICAISSRETLKPY